MGKRAVVHCIDYGINLYYLHHFVKNCLAMVDVLYIIDTVEHTNRQPSKEVKT